MVVELWAKVIITLAPEFYVFDDFLASFGLTQDFLTGLCYYWVSGSFRGHRSFYLSLHAVVLEKFHF